MGFPQIDVNYFLFHILRRVLSSICYWFPSVQKLLSSACAGPVVGELATSSISGTCRKSCTCIKYGHTHA